MEAKQGGRCLVMVGRVPEQALAMSYDELCLQTGFVWQGSSAGMQWSTTRRGWVCLAPVHDGEKAKSKSDDLRRWLVLVEQISRLLGQEGNDLEAVKKKFSSSKFGAVATLDVKVLSNP